MSEQLTDQILVERVQKGDQKAFNLLVVRYQHKVASLVSRYVPSGDVHTGRLCGQIGVGVG